LPLENDRKTRSRRLLLFSLRLNANSCTQREHFRFIEKHDAGIDLMRRRLSIVAQRKKVRGRVNLTELFLRFSSEEFFIAAITTSELLHGVERTQPAARTKERSA